MTERLYYDMPELTEFEAVVTLEHETADGREIALDRSAFYPTSGGQPYDTGRIGFAGGEAHVTNVQADDTGEVWHTIDARIAPGTAVTCRIDKERRRDHTEQHAGEHMIAGAIWELLHGTTIGLHLGSEDSSIDVTMPDGRTRLTRDEINAVEDLVNRRIRMDAPIRCYFPDPEELAALPLRKAPTVKDHVRVVQMGDFEAVACGGTHPSSTGKIGCVKILSAEPARGKVRVTFICGGRAAKRYQELMASSDAAGALLSCPADKLPEAVQTLRDRLTETEKNRDRLLTARMLDRLRAGEEKVPERGVSVSAAVDDDCGRGPATEAVSRYISDVGRIALVCAGGALVYGCSKDVSTDMCALIRKTGRGGGRPDMASGAGDAESVRKAKEILKNTIA